jgi:ABC-2 type transport system ATP-binding protein
MGANRVPQNTSAAVSAEQLSKSYRGKRRKIVHALKSISLAVPVGEVFGFLGPNGAGKSTTIKLLVGLIRPSAGEARLFGVAASNPRARLRVGYLPENPSFYDFLTAREYLRFVASSFSMSLLETRQQTTRVLGLLNLEAAADRPIRSYSKGMVQRLGLAQTLFHDPDLYILDEPMSGLDPIGRALVKEIMLDLKRQRKTVFFSTHVTADVERVCDRIGVIVGGVFQEERVVEDLLREGIDGYFCRVRGIDSESMKSLSISTCGGDLCELFVPRDRFDSFAAELLKIGGSFELVEPRRRDVEDYFLNLVRTAGGEQCD